MHILSVVAPVFGLILLGYLLRRAEFLGEREVSALMKVAYYVALPAAIFASLASFELEAVLNRNALAGTVVATFSFALGFYAVTRAAGATSPVGAAATVTAFRGNFVFVAFPIVYAAWGDLALAKAALLTGVLAPLVTVATIILFRHAEGTGGQKGDAQKSDGGGLGRRRARRVTILLVKAVIDPIVLASAGGLAVSYLALTMPDPLQRTIDMLADMAQPAALLAIGSSFGLQILARNKAAIAWSTVAKLALLPAWGYAVLVGILDVPQGSLDVEVGVLLLAAPSAISTYVMARELSSKSAMVGTNVVLTTALAAVTMSAWLAFLL